VFEGDEPGGSETGVVEVRGLEVEGVVETVAEHEAGAGTGVGDGGERAEESVPGVFVGVGQLHVGLRSDCVLESGEAEGEALGGDPAGAREDQEGVQGEAEVHEGVDGHAQASAHAHLHQEVRGGGTVEDEVRREGREGARGDGEADRGDHRETRGEVEGETADGIGCVVETHPEGQERAAQT
jgi:hypothetical protein